MTAITIIVIAIVLYVLGTVGYLYLQIKWLTIDLYFLRFKIEDHPILITMVDDVFKKITEEEGIRVFYKTIDELNEGVIKEEEKALALYVHCKDEDIEINKKFRQEIDELERKWHRPYKEICKIIGTDTKIREDTFILPRIILCKEQIQKFGLLSFYGTHFHELGHHFAIKANGDCTENAANIEGYKLVLKHLPYFFQLFTGITLRDRIGLPELTVREKLRAYYQYLIYLRIKNKK